MSSRKIRKRKRAKPVAEAPSVPRNLSTRAPTLPAWKKAIFAAVAVCGFFLILEGVLALAGFHPVFYQQDPYVGFSSSAPLFVENDDGWMTTAPNKLQAFNEQRFLKKKPPGTYRIFSVGGSTTYGRPYDDHGSFNGWLREVLNAADSSKNWEAINAGGISYASYRVAKVMEELAEYEPDLFVIYSGHNEFLERRTYATVIEAPKFVVEAGGLLSRTRIYAAGRHFLDPPEPAPAARNRPVLATEVDAILDHSVGPEDYVRDDEWAAQVFAHYRFNLSRMIDIARSVGARIVLVTPASNLRDCSPFKSDPPLTSGGNLEAVERSPAADSRSAAALFEKGRLLDQSGRYAEAKQAFEAARDQDVCPLRAPSKIVDTVAEISVDRNVPLVDFAALMERRSRNGITGADYFLDHVHLTLEGYRFLALDLFDELQRLGIVTPGNDWGEERISEISNLVRSKIDEEAQGIALRNLAKVFDWAGKQRESEELAIRAAELVGDDAESYAVLGRAAAGRGEVAEAQERYRRALAIRPEFPEVLFNLGFLLLSEGEVDEAIERFDAAIRLKPSYPEAHRAMGIALAALRRPQAAEASLRRALELRPKDAESHFHLGGVLLSLGRPDDAIWSFIEATRLRPNYAEAHSNLGIAYVSKQQTEKAVQHFRLALEIDPDYAAAHFNLANALAAGGAFAAAKAHFRETLRIRPGYKPATDALGRVEVLAATKRK